MLLQCTRSLRIGLNSTIKLQALKNGQHCLSRWKITLETDSCECLPPPPLLFNAVSSNLSLKQQHHCERWQQIGVPFFSITALKSASLNLVPKLPSPSKRHVLAKWAAGHMSPGSDLKVATDFNSINRLNTLVFNHVRPTIAQYWHTNKACNQIMSMKETHANNANSIYI